MKLPSNYFIDESGNTGDLSAVKLDSYFTEQRLFCLAAVGLEIDDDFIRAVAGLKAVHRMQAPEIKARQS